MVVSIKKVMVDRRCLNILHLDLKDSLPVNAPDISGIVTKYFRGTIL